MKKLLPLLLLFFTGFSCSDSEDSLLTTPSTTVGLRPGPVTLALDHTKLAKVIFYPGTTSERRWLFYPNGLLKKITNHVGTTLQTFYYNANNDLIKTDFPNPMYYYEFFYDVNHVITSAVYHTTTTNHVFSPTFYPSENKYIYGDVSSPNHTDVALSPEGLFLSTTIYYQSDDSGTLVDYADNDEHASYSAANNQIAYTIDNNPDPTIAYFHDLKINPLKKAVYPVSKAFSCIPYSVYIDGELSEIRKRTAYNSQNNVIGWFSGSLDRGDYTYEFNAIDLPTKRLYSYYFQEVLDASGTDILYYYQGDVIP